MRSRLQIFLMLIIACLVFNSRTQAQTQTRLSIQVVDTTSLEPVLGAMVELVAKDSTKIRTRYTSTDYKGSAAFGSVELGEYFLRTSLIGYVTKQVPLNIDKNPFGMVVVDLVVNAHDIEQINFSAHSMRTSQMGDTLAYNAEAFKVSRDADAEDLLAKMPGISVTDGVVEAQGEQVQKVLVDGRELFGDDVTSAIRNIPAEAIKSVEVFDKKSDEAEFSGVDDGEDYKAINFVTKPGMSNGTFGKISGSYVPDDRYSLGASINSFRGERKISLTATSNNINQQSFSIDDILGSVGSSGGMSSGKDSKGGASSYMTSSQSGVSTSNYFSLNYSEKYSEKVSATAGYSFNGTDNYLDQYSERIYTVNADSLQNYDSQYYSNSDNYNHRFNGMFEWSMNANNSLMFRPNISIQDYTSSTSTLADNYIVTSTETIEQSTYEDASSQDKFGYNMSGSLVYRHKFNDSGRSLNLSANGRISDSDNDQLSDSYTKYMTADTEEETNQETISKSASHSFTGKVSYMEPLGEYTHIIANYEYDNSYSDTDKRAYMYNPLTGGYDDFSASLSNTYQSTYVTHSIGPSFRYNTKNTRFVGEVAYQYATLSGNQDYPVIDNPEISNDFEDITYFAMLRHQFNQQNSINLRIRSNTSTPTVSQLQDVVDISNPLFVSAGNPDLQPTYTNSASVQFINSNITKGRTFMAMLSADIRQDYIGQSVIIAQGEDLELDNDVTLMDGSQYTVPVNLDGYKSFKASISYGLPVSFLRSNLNLDLGASYTTLPSLINYQTNETETYAYSGGAVLGSNISERIDFTVSYKGAYNIAKNSIQTSSDNTYLSQSASLKLKVEAWWGLTLSVNGSYNQYRGITDDYNEEYILCSAALGKKIFNNRRGEISVGVSDLFDQNTSFVRTVTDTYIENVTSNVLGRMFNLTFTYNLRAYGK